MVLCYNASEKKQDCFLEEKQRLTYI